MGFRLDPVKYGEFRAKIQFTTAASMPHRIYQACLASGIVSNTRYCQIAVCERLSKDLGIPLEELLAELPRSRGPAGHLYDPSEGKMARDMDWKKTAPVSEDNSGGVVRVGPANTVEEVF